ncbi:hypothetical protein AYI68_g2872 [Smittium mucronatum]|uniref:SCP domain-containing protein n=1 Tax=Smittium mucronatum TaxID=133383 RepID=A0A1R0H1K1_9FUNG|nr:hypothetical protein AYI68_g2872 [Smittium mucronatum]
MRGLTIVNILSILAFVSGIPQDTASPSLVDPSIETPATEVPPSDSSLSKRASNSDFPSYIIGVVCETNKVRKQNNLPPLQIYAELNTLAQKHTQYMVDIKTLTHEDAEGTLGTRLSRDKVKWSFCAENVASGFLEPAKVVEAWMNSPGHRANILNTRVKAIGIGNVGNFWTQNFSDFASGFNFDGYEPKC